MTESLLGNEKLWALMTFIWIIKDIPGELIELGVYKGGTLKEMAKRFPDRTCYGLDTFTGLPKASWKKGEKHKVGEFKVDFDTVVSEMPKNVILIPGLFPESAASIPESVRFSFAHVDMDYEKSTDDAINWLIPRMSEGGVIVFDDWHWKDCPGVTKAIQDSALRVKEITKHQCYARIYHYETS